MIKRRYSYCLSCLCGKIAAVIGLLLLIFTSAACEKPVEYVIHTVIPPESKVPNVSIVDLNYTGLIGSKPKTMYVTDADAASEELDRYGFSDDAKKIYDEEWFQKNCLVMVMMGVYSSFGYSVTDMDISEDLIKVHIQEMKPSGYTDLLVFKAILIGISKEEAPAVAEVEAEIETVYQT